ncbi:hypothetical protein D7V91_10000 [bacterium 1xD42-67]|nr:hypothetical protein D7V91_10000 [bacterium 1xD42-67]
MQDRYRCEMERLGPSQEALDRLCTILEEGSEMRHRRRIRRRMAAVLVCAVLMVTVVTAAVPTVREVLLDRLGIFAPYIRTIEGAVCRDQGIEIQVLGALADDLEGYVYLAVRDVDGDRLDECLTLKGRLTTGTKRAPDDGKPAPAVNIVGTGSFSLLSYDPDTRTALLSASVFYGDTAQPSRDAQLSVTGMSTREGDLHAEVSCGSVTGETLESLPVEEEAEVILRSGGEDDPRKFDAMLPRQAVVLAPEQNPMSFEETEDIWISSMGFASDGCFHIRLGLAEGVRPKGGGGFFTSLFLPGADERIYIYQQTLVEGGMDILFPLFHKEDLELLQSCKFRPYGAYARNGRTIEGSWTLDFQMEHYRSLVLDQVGELAGRQVQQMTVSPLSVTMHSNDPGGFHNMVLYAVKKDGSKVAAQPGIGRYANAGIGTGETIWETFNTWSFESPIDLEDVVALELAGERIPI